MVNYTTINHEARKKYGLTMNEYAVCDLIYNLSNNPKGDGWCTASKEWIGDQLFLTKRNVNKIILRLLEKGLIEKRSGNLNKSKGDHIKVTTNWYEAVLIKGGNKEPISNKRWDESSQKVGTNDPKRWDDNSHNKDILYKDTNKDIVTDVTRKRTNDLLKGFEGVNPNYEKLYSNKTERKALDELVEKYGYEKIERLLQQLPQIIQKPYAPRITTPYILQKRMGELVAFVQQEQGKEVYRGSKTGIDASHL